jgi:predicted GNAT family acetyltransferase
MTDYNIERQDHGTHGRYVIALESGEDAELTYRFGAGVLTVLHTSVPPEFEGRGIAAALMDRVVADARAGGFKIRPACSYATARFKRKGAEWADVLA